MSNMQKRLLASAVVLFAAIGSASIASSGDDDSSLAGPQTEARSGPVQCEIQTSSANGMITLQGVVYSEVEANGSYRFQVKNAGDSGNSNIRQGGNFSAEADETVTLGKMVLGGRGAIYDATLEVALNGQTIECGKRVGGAI